MQSLILSNASLISASNTDLNWYDDVEVDFLELPQIEDLEASDNGGIYL